MTTLRVKVAKVIKPFVLPRGGETWPVSSKIELDKSAPVKRKLHQLIYQQGKHFGQVGDRCEYLSHDDLFELQELGFIKIN